MFFIKMKTILCVLCSFGIFVSKELKSILVITICVSNNNGVGLFKSVIL